jgi:hydrogenase expression/formation protein HypD
MKFLDEYRNPALAVRYLDEIISTASRPWTIMEVCGGQTHAIIKNGLDRRLAGAITFLHGPGCPVCVTAVETIDKALLLAARQDVIFCSFGDMLRVRGSRQDLLSIKAHGGDVRIVYSPLDAVKVAQANPLKEVIFFAIGFETTAPANAAAVLHARRHKVENFSILCAQVLIPPAVAAILDTPKCKVQAMLAPGHICSVTGYIEYEQLVSKYSVPIIVTGFEPVDILQGVCLAVVQLEQGEAAVQNQYARAVRRQGNVAARELISRVFRVVDRQWRGLGKIPNSGLDLNDEYADFDAEQRFDLDGSFGRESASVCISGLILQGHKKPWECPAFSTECTPHRPLGATMVSAEGVCAAYYRYGSYPNEKSRTTYVGDAYEQ